jgi:hypothetical protein
VAFYVFVVSSLVGAFLLVRGLVGVPDESAED